MSSTAFQQSCCCFHQISAAFCNSSHTHLASLIAISLLPPKAVNREDKRSRRYRDGHFAKFERSRRYRHRYRC